MKPVKPVTWALLGIFSVYLAVVAASAYKEGSNRALRIQSRSSIRTAALCFAHAL